MLQNVMFFHEIWLFIWYTLLRKFSALLAGNLQKSYFVFQILPFVYRLTEFYKMCNTNAENPCE